MTEIINVLGCMHVTGNMSEIYKISTLLKNCKTKDVLAYRWVKDHKFKLKCTPTFLIYVMRHFNQVLRHRFILYKVYEVIKPALSPADARLKNRISFRVKTHDLSKLSLEEIIGFTVRFHLPENLTEENKVKWDKALQHHYLVNDHHPEFEPGKDMKIEALIESVIDMIACHVHNYMKNHALHISHFDKIPKEEFFNINPDFFKRYTEKDQEKVELLLKIWSKMFS